MNSSPRILSLVLLISLLAACQSGSGGSNGSDSARSARGGAAPAEDRIAENPPAVHNRVRNCRIISYDPRTQATIILINAAHAWRETEQGQLNITNGNRNQTYKVLTDLQIDSLLETLEQRGSKALRENFDERHAALLGRRAQEGDAFKGIIILENDGRRDSFIARRPSGANDAMGVERYRIYSDLRQAIFVWERAGLTEQVGSAGLGQSSPDSLGVPRDNRR